MSCCHEQHGQRISLSGVAGVLTNPPPSHRLLGALLRTMTKTKAACGTGGGHRPGRGHTLPRGQGGRACMHRDGGWSMSPARQIYQRTWAKSSGFLAFIHLGRLLCGDSAAGKERATAPRAEEEGRTESCVERRAKVLEIGDEGQSTVRARHEGSRCLLGMRPAL